MDGTPGPPCYAFLIEYAALGIHLIESVTRIKWKNLYKFKTTQGKCVKYKAKFIYTMMIYIHGVF